MMTKSNIAPSEYLKRSLRRFNPLQFGWSIVRAVILLGLCFVILYPFFIKIVNGFKGFDDILDTTVRYIPKAPSMDSWIEAYTQMEYLNALVNTLEVSIIGGVLQTLMAGIVGYGFARFKFRGNGILFLCVIMTLLVPPQTIMIPLYETFRFPLGLTNVKLIGTLWPIIILSLTGLGLRNGLYIFMFRQSFRNMPRELEEAAYIDGCGPFGTFFKVMFPSARSIIVTVALFSFSWQWTDIFYNDLLMSGRLVLATAAAQINDPNIDPMMESILQNCGAVLAILPLAFLYLFAQRSFVQSVERSGIVG